MITHHETALHKQEPRSMKERSRGGINMLSDDESQVQKGGKWEPDANTQGLCLLNLVNPPEKNKQPLVNYQCVLDNSTAKSSDKGLRKQRCLQMKVDEIMLYPKMFR